ncbi:hypothetical protein MUN84_15785 [Hymenobacter sp. 5516J-16]|uniref:hypothetical protein n=1 Tax=Hymenobacter sp. 5516J-16 TaxID=2932253 RepID=UPI001FD1BE73|nr:hypothetical protein [Hymenobacter sp. 5516J-16]UOQ76059.1 hypothetical protein MUN84_15785 [Hymenobacter sp. 5516J-16]
MEKEIHLDICCCALAKVRTKEVIYSVLNEFTPNHTPLRGDYGCLHVPFNNLDYEFISEDAMLGYYVWHPIATCSFFWESKKDWAYNPTVGAFFTSDGFLIMSVTIDGSEADAQHFLSRLKACLNSEVGVISHINPPDFLDGQDFFNRYK